ncbi:MAG: pilus assembly PilX N-terminal domain-containing protein [Sedimentisphaerales bacterium]|nr:pilus assembly PilX N-terminal domain-containing protein [Sedimentisphaerales bacterium]
MYRQATQKAKRGLALILSLVFLAIFSTLAVGMATLSSRSVQVANNQATAARARACAESGIDFMKYWMSRVHLSGLIAPTQRFTTLVSQVQADLLANGLNDVIVTSRLWIGYNGTGGISLNPARQESFYGFVCPIDTDTVRIEMTGRCGAIDRTVAINYTFGVRQDSVFDFGVASRGPLCLSGNIDLTGYNVAVEADVYLESLGYDTALSIIGNSQIAGNVSIVNPAAEVILQGGQASIGGETGQDAIDNHVELGVPATQFPEPNPTYFEKWVENDLGYDADLAADGIYQNIRIPAGMNPTFSGDVTLQGVIYVEQPNVVTFTGNCDITGIIVGEGDETDESQTNQLVFQGNVSSSSVETLPMDDEHYIYHDWTTGTDYHLQTETGTFVMAPGFGVAFGGSFDTLNGAIAGNGITFFGNAGGVIGGSVINYSDTPMTLSGNADLIFNRSGIEELPAGFFSEIVMHYDAESYSEIL